jgi:predicted RNase H-like HicB family nuclease
MTLRSYTLEIHDEDDGSLWAQVAELPGCFASGNDVDELLEAAAEAIGMYLADTPVRAVQGRIEGDGPEPPVDLHERRLRRLGGGSLEREVRYSPREVAMVVEG